MIKTKGPFLTVICMTMVWEFCENLEEDRLWLSLRENSLTLILPDPGAQHLEKAVRSLSLQMFEQERPWVGHYLSLCSLALGPVKTLPRRMISSLCSPQTRSQGTQQDKVWAGTTMGWTQKTPYSTELQAFIIIMVLKNIHRDTQIIPRGQLCWVPGPLLLTSTCWLKTPHPYHRMGLYPVLQTRNEAQRWVAPMGMEVEGAAMLHPDLIFLLPDSLLAQWEAWFP